MSSPLPKTLGRYQILEQIGKGAMGVVYLARDPTIGRLVALKTFRIGEVSEEERIQYRQRFMREAQSAGILSHPNIVTIHDFVEDSTARMTFIAMEFIRGTDLKELLRRDDPFDLPFISGVVWQVAEALEYAHSKGVVHRDIKPANILITGDDRVKLTDFGIARLNNPQAADLTHAGQLLGTPNYMAPEQLLGKEVDHRADVFSLGVVLYEMLTRHKPFQGDNLTVVTQRILHDSFTPPEEYVGELPPGLGAVLARALAKEPGDRYQRVGELARDLKAVSEQRSSARGSRRSLPAAAGEAAAPGASAGGAAGPLRDRLRGAVAPLLERLLPPRERRPPPLRYAIVSAAGLLIGLAIALGAIAWVASPDTAAQDAATDREIARRFHFLPWVWMGRSLLARGEAGAAAAAFSEAARRAPEEGWIGELRREAEAKAAAEVAEAQLAEEAAALVEEGQEALGRRRFQEAETAATQALELVPGEPRALELLGLARAAMSRRREAPPRLQPPVPAAPSRAEAEEVPASAAPGPEAPAAEPPASSRSATLRVVFRSQRPEGVLTLYAGEQQLLREPFRFTQRSGLFRTKGVPGGFERSLEIRPGQATLRVYLALDRTRVEMVEGNFPAGVARTLEIDVADSGELTISLR